MSMSRTKENLLRFLSSKDIRVLALSGKWGTGKSHMWKSLRDNSRSGPEVNTALYVSLFGVTTITELKFKLTQAAAPLLDKNGPTSDAVKSVVSGMKQIAQGFLRTGSAFDEFALLAVPALVRGRFIVIDDIERKHEKLSIDEILGFIDDFTQNYVCRVLLIMNSDKLSDKAIWEKFREKVIDVELRLNTTPSEAFDIAVGLCPSEFADKIKVAVVTCGITNIRIIRKIIRAVNTIFSDHLPLQEDVLNRTIPSTVLLSAIHYKGIEDGPTMDYILDFESLFQSQFENHVRGRNTEEASEESKLHAKWTLLFERLGIAGTDEYEKVLCDYLISGLLDSSALDTIVDRYRKENRLAGAQFRSRTFFQNTIWDPEMTVDEILEAGRALLDDVRFLDCYTVTSLHDRLLKFDGGKPIADQMVTSWVEQLLAKVAEPEADPSQFILDNWGNRPLHPSIRAAFVTAESLVKKPKTLFDTCLYLAENNGWNSSDEVVMKSATVSDYQKTILDLRGEPLKMFMLKNMDIYVNNSTYEKHFGSAPANFVEACRRIYNDRAGTRWASLIKDVFDDSKLGDHLEAVGSATDK
ncbi:P-loop NTPase fold protein [Undibacterium sp.]|uniref:P-loop NTPase fold protein n=1 Tax=Undibacterium sp. TaxID=1914977 RepID=UPI003753882A